MGKCSTMLALLVLAGTIGCTKPRIFTMERYQQLSRGMSYKEAVKILGKEGQESGIRQVPVAPGSKDLVWVRRYAWTNPDGTSITATFVDDKLEQKGEAGL